jgi:hypothetical protein
VARALDREPRPVYALFEGEPQQRAADYARFGLELVPERCVALRSNVVPPQWPQLRLCPAERRVPATVALEEIKAQWDRRCRVYGPDDRVAARACRALAEGAR